MPAFDMEEKFELSYNALFRLLFELQKLGACKYTVRQFGMDYLSKTKNPEQQATRYINYWSAEKLLVSWGSFHTGEEYREKLLEWYDDCPVVCTFEEAVGEVKFVFKRCHIDVGDLISQFERESAGSIDDRERFRLFARLLVRETEEAVMRRRTAGGTHTRRDVVRVTWEEHKTSAPVLAVRDTDETSSVLSIARGFPYFVDGETIHTHLTRYEFYLAAPKEQVRNEDNGSYFRRHHFASEDAVFGGGLDEICRQIPVDHIRQMIEESREKVFLHFLNEENGCYFNNKKYGIHQIRPFGRTEDLSERPVLEIELFTTDYFTHKVMKDVCRRLVDQGHPFIKALAAKRFFSKSDRIFLTSLGINLVLAERSPSGEKVLLTVRSPNATDTQHHVYSVSVIEGVSLKDFSEQDQAVSLKYAALRGVKEELGIDEDVLHTESLYFYDIFINQKNLEIGLSCSVDLKEGVRMEDVLSLTGQDHDLEVADKKTELVENLMNFISENRGSVMPQAEHTILTFCRSR